MVEEAAVGRPPTAASEAEAEDGRSREREDGRARPRPSLPPEPLAVTGRSLPPPPPSAEINDDDDDDGIVI